MKKKLIALAVAGAFAAPIAAQADSSNVTIYGRFHNSWDFSDANPAGGANGSRKNGASNNSSAIGFKGSEDLGNGLKAGFVIESSLGEDNANSSGAIGGTGGTNSGILGSRNTFATIGGGWGTYLIGKVDNTYKTSTLRLDPFIHTVGNYVTLLSQANNGTNIYDTRAMHAGAYITPTWNGFTAVVGYVPHNGAGATAISTTNGTVFTGQDNTNGLAWAATIMYDNGPLYVSASHIEAKLGAVPSAINSTKFGIGYTFGDIAVGGVFEMMRDPNSAGVASAVLAGCNPVSTLPSGGGAGVGKCEHDVYVINVKGKFQGDNEWALQYERANDISGATATAGTLGGTGAKVWTAGLWHHFSKRTKIYTVYAKLNNDANASYTMGASGGHGDGVNGGPGSSPSNLSFGMVHEF